MKRYKISKQEEYTDKSGQRRTVWRTVGYITEIPKADGKIATIVEIPAIGLKGRAFLIEPKEQQKAKDPYAEETEEINTEDIPF